jgi:hypothetical protein
VQPRGVGNALEVRLGVGAYLAHEPAQQPARRHRHGIRRHGVTRRAADQPVVAPQQPLHGARPLPDQIEEAAVAFGLQGRIEQARHQVAARLRRARRLRTDSDGGGDLHLAHCILSLVCRTSLGPWSFWGWRTVTLRVEIAPPRG